LLVAPVLAQNISKIFITIDMISVAPYPFSLPDFGRVNYPYPGNYPVIFSVTA